MGALQSYPHFTMPPMSQQSHSGGHYEQHSSQRPDGQFEAVGAAAGTKDANETSHFNQMITLVDERGTRNTGLDCTAAKALPSHSSGTPEATSPSSQTGE